MAFIKFNYKQFIKDYIPGLLRLQFNLDFIYSLLIHSFTRYNELLLRRDEDLFITGHTGQVMSLQHLLNNKIDVVGKPIVITDTGNIPQWYAGLDGEPVIALIDFYTKGNVEVQYNPNKPYLGKDSEAPANEYVLYVGDDATTITDTVDFIVYMDYIDYNDQLKYKLTEYYVVKFKLGGFSFKILPY